MQTGVNVENLSLQLSPSNSFRVLVEKIKGDMIYSARNGIGIHGLILPKTICPSDFRDIYHVDSMYLRPIYITLKL